MNNEEKILALLEQAATRQEKTETLLETIQTEQRVINDRLVKLEVGQATLEAGQIEIKAEQADAKFRLSEMNLRLIKLGTKVDGLVSDLSETNSTLKAVFDHTVTLTER
jgi:hypothetical protein